MGIQLHRILKDLDAVTGISDPRYQEGCTRHSWSREDAAVRAYLMQELKAVGAAIQTDGVGNIRARLVSACPENPPVLVGSHIDTVTCGGRFDGLLGVLCALECLRVFQERQIPLRYSPELVIFAEEEGSHFGITLMGSKAMTGKLTPEDLLQIRNDAGETADAVIRRAGFDPDRLPQTRLEKGTVRAMIELHVEQGGILDERNIPVGIVETIAGIRTFRVTLEGVSNHAGSTPMWLRQDPMAGASQVILGLQRAALEKDRSTEVATVGRIACRPNIANAVAGQVEFYADIRDVRTEGMDRLQQALETLINSACETHRLTGRVEQIAHSDAVHLAPGIIETIQAAARRLKIPYLNMNSGAVHDSVMLTELTDVGMIFVPSIGGRSHCPQEKTSQADIETGCRLLLETLQALCR